MSTQWTQRKEGGGRTGLRFIRWVALSASPRLARALLYPITLYFLIVRDVERRASRLYLRRVLGREPDLRHVARHIHTFARTILDRVFLLSGRFEASHIRLHGQQALHDYADRGVGVLLFGSHLGSFEVVRVTGLSRNDVVVKILMDYGHNRRLALILDALNPRAVETLIDASGDSTQVLLKMHEVLDAGGLMGMLADRPHVGEPTVTCSFFGEPVQLPTSPFRIASVLKAPVFLIFGLLRPNGDYDVYFEKFADQITLARNQREEQARVLAQRYAERLEFYAREAPYNWFNFYDFWNDGSGEAKDGRLKAEG